MTYLRRELDRHIREAQAEMDELAPDPLGQAMASIQSLSPEQRLTVFHRFCFACGIDDPYCRCWDDS